MQVCVCILLLTGCFQFLGPRPKCSVFQSVLITCSHCLSFILPFSAAELTDLSSNVLPAWLFALQSGWIINEPCSTLHNSSHLTSFLFSKNCILQLTTHLFILSVLLKYLIITVAHCCCVVCVLQHIRYSFNVKVLTLEQCINCNMYHKGSYTFHPVFTVTVSFTQFTVSTEPEWCVIVQMRNFICLWAHKYCFSEEENYWLVGQWINRLIWLYELWPVSFH